MQYFHKSIIHEIECTDWDIESEIAFKMLEEVTFRYTLYVYCPSFPPVLFFSTKNLTDNLNQAILIDREFLKGAILVMTKSKYMILQFR